MHKNNDSQSIQAKAMKDPTIGLTAFIDILGFGDIVVAAETLQDVNNITTQIQRVQCINSNMRQRILT